MRPKWSLHYSVDGGDRFEVETRADRDAWGDLAEEAAEDFHSMHDGREADWPLTITLHLDSDVEVEVDREAIPQFTAQTIHVVPDSEAPK